MSFETTNPALKNLARAGSNGKSGGEDHPAAAKARAQRKAVNELLDDPTFDRTLGASRQRLLDALAIYSTMALRMAENGMSPAATDALKNAAAIYRQLAAGEDPLEQRPGESDEDYRARLTRVAGK